MRLLLIGALVSAACPALAQRTLRQATFPVSVPSPMAAAPLIGITRAQSTFFSLDVAGYNVAARGPQVPLMLTGSPGTFLPPSWLEPAQARPERAPSLKKEKAVLEPRFPAPELVLSVGAFLQDVSGNLSAMPAAGLQGFAQNLENRMLGGAASIARGDWVEPAPVTNVVMVGAGLLPAAFSPASRGPEPSSPGPGKAPLKARPIATGLGRGLFAGVILGLLAPYLYGLAPVHSLLASSFLFLAGVFALAVLVLLPYKTVQTALAWWRKRNAPAVQPAPKPQRRLTWGKVLGGLALGTSLALAPFLARPVSIQLLDKAISLQRKDYDALSKSYQRLPSSFKNIVIVRLSRNPEGRALLEKFRDIQGNIRLPEFFLIDRGDSEYSSLLDAVFIHDPDLASEEDIFNKREVAIFHELGHAAQARRPLNTPGIIQVHSQENEIEMYVRQNLYLYEKWKMQPPTAEDFYDIIDYEDFAVDLDGFLKRAMNMYPGLPHLPKNSAFYPWFEDFKTNRWPRLSAEGLIQVGDGYLARSDSRFMKQTAEKFYRMAAERARAIGDSQLEAQALERLKNV